MTKLLKNLKWVFDPINMNKLRFCFFVAGCFFIIIYQLKNTN